MAAKLFLPLFLPVDYTTHLRRLKQEHSAELSALLQPLERLSHREREAVGASGIAQAAALAWEANADVLAALLPRAVQRTLALPAPGVADWILPQPVDSGAGTYDTAQQLLAHLARDWSADGASARAKTHRPVLRALRRAERQWRWRWRGAAPLRVLVPGAGMGRLAWEVARRGHRVEANDASPSMLVAAHALLSGAVARDALRFFPRIRCGAGALRRAPCLATSHAPDVAPAAARGGGNLTLQAGDFEELYSNSYGNSYSNSSTAPPWDALVTSYFIDTLSESHNGQTRRPACVRAGQLRLEALSRLLTHGDPVGSKLERGPLGRSGLAALHWSLSEAPPKTPVSLAFGPAGPRCGGARLVGATRAGRSVD